MKRRFLGNHRPLLHLTADYLIEQFGKPNQFDMRNVLLTMQEQRALNRLEEILAEHAESIDPAWYPPEFLTIGMLPEKLYELKRELADEPTQCFAWITAIDQLDEENPDLLRRLIPVPPRRDDLEARLVLGRLFAKLHRELAAGTLDFVFVAQLCRTLNVEFESDRWNVLAKLQGKYLAKLDALRFWDVQSARLFALEHAEEFESKHEQFQQDGTQILLVGVVDMNLAQKELLRHFGNFVTSLVFAPEDWAERFDDLGCLVPHIWQDTSIALNDRQIHIVESPGDQAETVLRCLTNLKGHYAPPQIIVGVPDKQVVPFIERQFEQADIKTRIVAGKPISQTSVYRFLETLLLFLESPSFARFAELVRHPDVETFLQKKLPQPINLLSELDRYYMEFLPATLTEPQSLDCAKRTSHSKNCGSINAIQQHLHTLLASQNIETILRLVFPKHHQDEAYRKILDVHSQIQKLPVELLSQPLSFPDTVRLVLTQAGNEKIPMPHEPKAVELVGWLDLAMDDAEVVIVTGMNDGCVPAFQTSDMFLPDRMRQQLSQERMLSIEDNNRRYARDAYALTCLLATRQYDPQRVQLIGSRRSAEGDPIMPSRLFFAADDETVTKRVRHFFAEQREPSPSIQFVHHRGKAPVKFEPPKVPENFGKTIREMSVTHFAKYKKCPYRYYLECCVHPRLQTVNDAESELSASAFGSLIHDVLESFGETEGVNRSTSAEEIRDFLLSTVRDLTSLRYGEQPRAVIAIQAERAVKRLEAFADWQARWASEYEILATELQFGDKNFSLDVDDDVMFLRGRIDRIDRHKKTNELIIWDYKTAGKPEHPKEHLKGGEWINFQLPLYYHLLDQHAEYSDFLRRGFRLGYIVLPSDTSKTGKALAEWDLPMVLSAVESARDIVRRIWNNEFEKVDPPPKYSEAFVAICHDF